MYKINIQDARGYFDAKKKCKKCYAHNCDICNIRRIITNNKDYIIKSK